MMRQMFNEVASNKLKSVLLICVFILVIGALGAAIGIAYGNAYFGLAISVIFSLSYSLIMFFSGDRMLLGISSAKPVTKQEHPYLYHTLEGLAIAGDIPVPKAYVIDDTAMNAFATGRDPKHASITVTTGLLKALNRHELEGVVAHEMSHVKNYDIRFMMMTAVLVGVVVLLGDFLLRTFVWGGSRHKSNNSRSSGQLQVILIVAGIALAILAPLIGELIKLAISRRREFTADASAAVLTRYPPGLAAALKKIANDPDPLIDHANRSTAHLFISTPFREKRGFVMGLFSTHPPIEERIKRLEEM